jgi:hypothetical protein
MQEAAEAGRLEFTSNAGPNLWHEYMREDIPALFGLRFTPGSWNQGFLVNGNNVFLLVTLNKSDMPSQFQYADRFVDPSHFLWHSQNQTKRTAKHGRAISNPDFHIHLFARATKKRPNGKASPFFYCGLLKFESWEGDQPIEVRWRLLHQLPDHMHKTFIDS